MTTKQAVLRMDVNVISFGEVINQIVLLAAAGNGGYICFANVHMCMETIDSLIFRNVVNRANLVLADGKPIAIAQKIFGNNKATQIRGPDVMGALCKLNRNIKFGLYGGTSDAVLQLIKKRLHSLNPDINVHYLFSPPFRPLTREEDLDIISSINSSELDILFVGIGCPKQEIWMADHKAQLSCVMLGVGAAFDYIAGVKKEAPRWIQKIGMEWLFRLIAEPKRLWRRYLNQNPRFIWHIVRQWAVNIVRK